VREVLRLERKSRWLQPRAAQRGCSQTARVCSSGGDGSDHGSGGGVGGDHGGGGSCGGGGGELEMVAQTRKRQ
jgi:hypothetical protein